MSNGSMEVGWNHHLTSDYQRILYWVAYLQGVRMIADTIAEMRNPTPLPDQFDSKHATHTRLAMHNTIARRASCSCTGCSERKRDVISTARHNAAQYMRHRPMRGGGIVC